MEINLDNSAFSLLSSCEYLFQQKVIRGLAPPTGDPASFGSAVHTGLELTDKGQSFPEVMTALHKAQTKNLPKVLSTLTFLNSSARPLPPAIRLLDNTPAIELKFRHKYASVLVPNLADLLDIYLVGTIDRIYLDDKNDELVILDYKTTAAVPPGAIDKILKGYSLSFQLPFYVYALLKFGILPASYMSYLIERKYRMEIMLIAYNCSPPVRHHYHRSAFNDDYIVREIPLIINNRISKAIEIANLTSQAPKTGFTVYQACNNCDLRSACLSSGTAQEAEILSGYERKPYDPLSFR